MGWIYMKVFSQIFSSLQDGKIEKWYHYIYSIWEWVSVWNVGEVQGSLVEVPSSWLISLAPNPNFLQWLETTNRYMVDVVMGGALMGKTNEATYELLKESTSNNYQWPLERSMPIKVGVDKCYLELFIWLFYLDFMLIFYTLVKLNWFLLNFGLFG